MDAQNEFVACAVNRHLPDVVATEMQKWKLGVVRLPLRTELA
jgi:hypothetical protein